MVRISFKIRGALGLISRTKYSFGYHKQTPADLPSAMNNFAAQ
jgi:hypothetical protein